MARICSAPRRASYVLFFLSTTMVAPMLNWSKDSAPRSARVPLPYCDTPEILCTVVTDLRPGTSPARRYLFRAAHLLFKGLPNPSLAENVPWGVGGIIVFHDSRICCRSLEILRCILGYLHFSIFLARNARSCVSA